MKRTVLLVVTCILLQSCPSQSDVDLAQIKLNQDRISEILPKGIKSITYDIGVNEGDYKYISTGSDKVLIFNQINFSGENPKANYENKAAFYFNKQDSIITRYRLETSVTEQSSELLETLKENLGKPNYTGFTRAKDKIDDNPSAFIWEATEQNTLYHLSYSKQHYGIEATLNVLPIMKIYPALPGITNWEDFIISRERKAEPNYTYQQYLNELLERDSDDIKNKLSR